MYYQADWNAPEQDHLIADFANTGWDHSRISRYFQVPERKIEAVSQRMAVADSSLRA
jgi:hypothetical protein